MKKLLVVLVLIIFFFVSCKNEKHFEFQNIEMKGTVSEFVSKLGKLGFEFNKIDNVFMLNGRFLHKDCAIMIIQKENEDISQLSVYSIPDKRNLTWDIIREHYYYVQDELIKLYGKPTYSTYGFDKPYSEQNWYDGIKNRACGYYSFWELNNGSIFVFINPDNICPPVPCIIYSDKINCKKNNLDIFLHSPKKSNKTPSNSQDLYDNLLEKYKKTT